MIETTATRGSYTAFSVITEREEKLAHNCEGIFKISVMNGYQMWTREALTEELEEEKEDATWIIRDRSSRTARN